MVEILMRAPDWRERGCLRDELLNGEIFYTLREAQIVVESWRSHYTAVRPHASLGYKPAHMPRSATNHMHQRSSCRHYPRGRLRADRLRQL
jgi:hypothetical protein